MQLPATLIFSTILFTGVVSCKGQQHHNQEPAVFEQNISNNKQVQLLDVRSKAEFETGYIPGAMQANWNDQKEFEYRTAFLSKNEPVYLYCLAGIRSAEAAKKLRQAGFKEVYALEGGILAWKKAGKHLEGTEKVKALSIEDFTNTIHTNPLVLVDIGAGWCPPCKKMEPVIYALLLKHPGKFTLLKVDAGKDAEILQQYNISSIPVFIIFKNGQQVWRKDAITEEKELEEQLGL
ncbi:MAG TPA: DUF953 domain-containing protein [Ferruginibacter sp.]|nr:DUF953 domain-containing protein [Ferruginibacter sp.]HMP21281.1 DUF953 domain-containing protein [Ferruginibacter sp.]